MQNKYIIGIDGGASKTTAILFDSSGNTIKYKSDFGSNLSVNEEVSSSRVANLISSLIDESKIQYDQISAIGIGLAGASNETGRQRLFGLLDNMSLSDKTIITNDVESIYEYIWKDKEGILVNVGTGIVCIAKKNKGFLKVAGNGHDNGDVGSGYWIGKEALIQLGFNEELSNRDNSDLLEAAIAHYKVQSYEQLIEKINESEDKVSIIASFAKNVLSLAENNNEVGVSIIQHSTRVVADYVIELRDSLSYGNKEIILAGNGSVLKNDYFRSELNNALSFEFSDIKWVFLDISPAYTSGILSARLKSIEIDIKKLLNNNPYIN